MDNMGKTTDKAAKKEENIEKGRRIKIILYCFCCFL